MLRVIDGFAEEEDPCEQVRRLSHALAEAIAQATAAGLLIPALDRDPTIGIAVRRVYKACEGVVLCWLLEGRGEG
jgi:hypothetical protein